MATIRDIVMYDDVGFDATHKHCLDFPNEADRDNYFSNLRDKTFFRDANYNKTENMLNLECEWETGLKFSYCSLTYNNKKMFFFVTGCKVVNEKVTGFQLVMDMWQTFLFDFKVGEGMITREHVDRWDRNGNVLWKKANSEDTPTNYKYKQSTKIYDTLHKHTISKTIEGTTKSLDFIFGAFVITAIKTNGSSQSSIESYISPCMIPVNDDLSSIKYFRSRNLNIYDDVKNANVEKPIDMLDGIAISRLGLTSDSVLSVSYTPYFPLNIAIRYDQTETYDNIVILNGSIGNDTTIKDGIPFHITPYAESFRGDPETNIPVTYITHGMVYENVSNTILGNHTGLFRISSNGGETNYITKPIKPNNNDNYSQSHEPELFKYPYIIRSFNDLTNQPMVEFNDIIWIDNYKLYGNVIFDNQNLKNIFMFLPPDVANGSSIYINNDVVANSMNNGLGVIVNGMNTDVPSDKWVAYVNQSRETDRQMLQSTITQQGITSMLSAMIGMGGISGMAGSGKGSGLGFNPSQAMAGAGIGAVMGGANWLVNSKFSWEQQQIKEQSIKNQANNLMINGDGEGYLKLTNPTYTFCEKEVNDTVKNIAGERFHKYGYRVDMMGIPNIKTRKHFNFVQTSQIRIEGSMNQAIRDNIADIFNNGVTIWHGEYISKESGTNKFITDYSKENIERSLI